MELVHFDFRRLCDDYDTALIGKRVILGNTIDELFYAVEDGTYESEVLMKMSKDTAPFWSDEHEDYFWYAYVLDEDFVGSDLHMVQELNSIVNYHNKNLTKKQFFFLSDLLDYMRSNYESRKV